ncbi:MAG TPA: UDP-N-acetylmuramoyl-tripeptide--D-alanyl-D-alanine ligase [Candidatus Limnocylindrales bacterium]|nr:UDP-N-acetylmuramoyl-tripeptide--D-alanyl-D-alanine ligase [Candidatus Limnocylindrales bacterium]
MTDPESSGRRARTSTVGPRRGRVDAPSAPPTDEPRLGLTADDLVAATGGRLLTRSDRLARGGAVDSRRVRPGNVFVALPGEQADGHGYLAEAVAGGAAALLVSRSPRDDEPPLAALGDVTIVHVEDGVRALGGVAAAWRTRFDPLVVGITGSIAKTSTKEAVAGVLGRHLRTLRNEGNLNNEIGLPLTVLDLGPEHEAAVLEMGMYVGGEIRDLAAIGRPRIGVVTAVQAVHLSRIGSLDAIERAKGELVEALPSATDGGVAVLNADDERVVRMAARTRARAVTYGFDADADVGASDVASAGFDGMRFVLRLQGGRSIPVRLPGLGRLAVHNALAAAAVGDAAGVPLGEIAAGLEAGWEAPHRTTVVRAGDVTIIDDSYNASPGAVRAALDLLAGLPGRRLAVLGEMLELGDAAAEGHRSVGAAAASVVELLVVVGQGARDVVDGALGAGLRPQQVVFAPDRRAALDALRTRLRPGDVVLVKASRGIELDRLVADLVADLRTGGTTA